MKLFTPPLSTTKTLAISEDFSLDVLPHHGLRRTQGRKLPLITMRHGLRQAQVNPTTTADNDVFQVGNRSVPTRVYPQKLATFVITVTWPLNWSNFITFLSISSASKSKNESMFASFSSDNFVGRQNND